MTYFYDTYERTKGVVEEISNTKSCNLYHDVNLFSLVRLEDPKCVV